MDAHNTHLTAITRNALSAPMAYLIEKGLITEYPGLDYGCGKGFDADYINFAKYDQHYFPDMPKGKFQTITCIYVLNVLPEADADLVMKDIGKRLNRTGTAFFAVRRDRFKEGKTSIGTFQRWVELPFTKLYERSGRFALYGATRKQLV